MAEAFDDTEFDSVILDPPPMRSALDLLDAPSSLANFVDEKIVEFFLGAGQSLMAPKLAVRVLGWVMGRGLAQELIEFFRVVAPL